MLQNIRALVVVEAESLGELRKRIYKMVKQLPNMVHTETLISIYNTERALLCAH